jgi:hypothetical protein
VGWIAHKIGILPAEAKPFARPLLVVGGVAACTGEGLQVGADLLRGGLLKWTCRALAVGIVVLVTVQAGAIARLWPEDSQAVFHAVFYTVPFIALGLLADAAGLWKRDVPRLGPAGAVAGGAGLLGVAVSMLGDLAWPFATALPLLAFAGFSFFRVRAQLRAALPAPVAVPQLPASPFKWSRGRR